MTRTIGTFESTPNPNALKCVVAPPFEGGRRSFRSLDEAADAGDELGAALLAIEGIERVMLLGDFLSVSKAPAAKWQKLKPAIKRAVEANP